MWTLTSEAAQMNEPTALNDAFSPVIVLFDIVDVIGKSPSQAEEEKRRERGSVAPASLLASELWTS
jgi:hypothetical protein